MQMTFWHSPLKENKDIPPDMVFNSVKIYKNGQCIRNKFAHEIAYAVAGLKEGRYDLTLIKDGMPISMVMGRPTHASVYFMAEMFEETPCNWQPAAANIEIYDDHFDWYGTEQRYSSRYF